MSGVFTLPASVAWNLCVRTTDYFTISCQVHQDSLTYSVYPSGTSRAIVNSWWGQTIVNCWSRS